MYCSGYVFATMALPYSQCTTGRGLVYSYVHVAPKTPSGTYLLFLHGFPSTSYHWRYQIHFFAKKGYGILAPDLLGFGTTSKPRSLEMYKAKDMASDIVDIMRAENVDKVVGIGHDWCVFPFALTCILDVPYFSSSQIDCSNAKMNGWKSVDAG
jgi:pimeloyl-ACP methyl ester carboxylesterase